jgi:putative hydrolase of the HAD superfamily
MSWHGPRAVLFDLDDTLYPEMEFVLGGFRAVAKWLAPRLRADEGALYEDLAEALRRDGRGQVFDSVLRSKDAWTEELARACLWVYRSHRPSLSLYREAAAILKRLKNEGLRLGVVTDGMGAVQQAKIDALGLRAMVGVVVCTDLLGPDASKPSGLGYRAALETLGVAAEEAVYVGDNPRKDFVWPNAHGMVSVHVRRAGSPADPPDLPAHAAAKHEIANLTELHALLETLRRRKAEAAALEPA